MKILLIAQNYPPETNAAAAQVSACAAHWAKWGHEVTVISACPNLPEGMARHTEQLPDGIRHIRVKTFVAANRGTLTQMLELVRFMIISGLVGSMLQRPDVVVANSSRLFAAAMGWLLGLRHLRPFVLELGDTQPPSIATGGTTRPGLGRRVVERIMLFLCCRAAVVVAPTVADKETLVDRGVHGGKITTLGGGIDLLRNRFVPVLPDGEAEEAEVATTRGPTGAQFAPPRRHAEEMLQVLEIAAAGYGHRISSDNGAETVA